MKGKIKPDHMPLNKFQLLVTGLPPLTCVTVSGIEEELQTVDMPDRTKRSGGNKNPVEFTITLPAHHTVEQAAMEIWYEEGQDPISPTYLKLGTFIMQSGTGLNLRSFSFIELFVSKRLLPDFDIFNEGEPAMIEWTLQASDMLPV